MYSTPVIILINMNYSIGTTYEGKDLAYLAKIAPYVDHIEVSPDSISTYSKGEIHVHPDILSQLNGSRRKHPLIFYCMVSGFQLDLTIAGITTTSGFSMNYSKQYHR